MKIGIVGGGINGLCCCWQLAKLGHEVSLYERNKLMQATSRASSKLLHGGLRYLENGEFRLVREALRERDAWMQRAPELTTPLRLVMPIYKNSRRSRFLVFAGLFLYDHIAGRSHLPRARWLNSKEILDRDHSLNGEDLLGGYEFSDGQMDDYALGLWVADQAKAFGAQIYENVDVVHVEESGQIVARGGFTYEHDRILNVAGPWANQLLERSGIPSPYRLDLVRGSHLVLDQHCAQAYLLEVPGERRIFFTLPWQGKTLVGTTEIRQALADPIECSEQERAYLLAAYCHYQNTTRVPEIMQNIAGLRPLLYSKNDPSRATREYAIHRTGKLITVFGGKWTTAMALAEKASKIALN